jgi:hypothetical protein
VEAKKLREGSSILRLEERQRGNSHVAFLGSLCYGWLSSTMEELVCDSNSKDFIKSFKEGSKVTIIQRGSNMSGQFLEVAMYAVGGWRGLIMVPKGREGRGWSRFAAEMSKVKIYFESMVGSSALMLGTPFADLSSLGKKDGPGLGVRSFMGGETPSYGRWCTQQEALLSRRLGLWIRQ